MARRNPADGAALDPALTQKKRARRRLVGALVLGVAAAIVLPLVLDSEPRQTISDVEIEIPPREAALPPVDSPTQPEAAAAPHAPAPADDALVPPPGDPMAAAARTEPKESAKADGKPDAKPPQARADAKGGAQGAAEPRSSSKNEAPKVATAKAPGEANSSGRAESSAGKSAPASAKSDPPAAAAGTRYALQVGAFANAGSARAQLDKARRTGLRAYTETVNTAQGERTRVRVGPFPTREEAEKARATLKLAGIDSAVVDAR